MTTDADRDWLPRDGDAYVAAVVGAGSWGTAMARHLCFQGLRTTLLCRRPEQAEVIRTEHRNPDYLPGIRLQDDLQAGTYAAHDLSPVDLVVLAVPSKAYRTVVESLAERIPPGVGVLSLTKGVEPGTIERLSVVAARFWSPRARHIAVLSGPNHAEEVSLDQPTATVIASSDHRFATTLQRLVSSESFRAYVNDDVIGVELASAVKNIIAVATGVSDGLGYGDNARAALMTRGLAEMIRLGVALGAKPGTFAGLAGMGDLVATCTSKHSRNRRAGELMAQGHDPTSVESEMGMVAEGLTAAPAVLKLAEELGIDMPITRSVVAIIQQRRDPLTCVRDLMARRPRPEQG